MRTPDPIGSETDPFSFELDGFELDSDRCLALRGRWFGVRGRRFVRPTLIMRIDGERHRLLADLDHKPWAAEEGEEWVASFSLMPPAGQVDEIELSVAPDITVSLAIPGSRALSPTVKRSAKTGKTSVRPASQRKRELDRGQPALDARRTKARDLSRQLEQAATESAGLAAERDALAAERDAITAERDRVQREHDRLRERVAELESGLRRSRARAKAALSKATEMLEAERAETNRVRSLLDLREAIAADRDRLAGELDTAIAQRDQLAAQASQAPTVAPDPRPVARVVPTRQPRRAHPGRRAAPAWAVRAITIIAMCAVLLTVAVVLHFV